MQETNPIHIIEAALFTALEPLSADKLMSLFDEAKKPTLPTVRGWIATLQTQYADSALELVEVASGYRFQVKQCFAESLTRLSEKKPARYSRSLMETLALIAYRQPITRGEIEEVRGVSVNPQVIRTLLDREWIKVAGHKEVPGKPALLATTKAFLDYFNLKSLSDLPPLNELVDFDSLEKQLGLQFTAQEQVESEAIVEEETADIA